MSLELPSTKTGVASLKVTRSEPTVPAPMPASVVARQWSMRCPLLVTVWLRWGPPLVNCHSPHEFLLRSSLYRHPPWHLDSSFLSNWCTLRAETGPCRRDSECRGYYLDCDRLDASPFSSGALTRSIHWSVDWQRADCLTQGQLTCFLPDSSRVV